MHDSVMSFGKKVLTAAAIKNKRVLEVGSMNVNGSLRGYTLSLGPASYVRVDFASGTGVDVVCDAVDLVKRFGDASFDVVISTEMLEHAENWRGAVDAMKQVLVPGGLLVLTMRGPGFPLHGYPHDWHRFTVEDTRLIFADFHIAVLEEDRQFPGVLLCAHKPARVNLAAIHVAQADALNAPR